MGRRSRRKRLAREAHRPEPEAPGPPRRDGVRVGAVCIFLMWMFVCGSVPAGLGLLAAVEPALAALLYRPAEGVVVGFEGDESDYPVVRYEAGGATHACTGWLPVPSGYSGGPVIPEGGRLRVYYPAGRPAEGFVCDWSEDRAPSFLYALGPGLAAAGLTTVFFRFGAGLPAGGLRRFARWAAKALAVWLGCVLLGAAGGLLLLGSNRALPAMLVGPVAGGALGGVFALRGAWRASTPACRQAIDLPPPLPGGNFR